MSTPKPKFPKNFTEASFRQCLNSGLTAQQIFEQLASHWEHDKVNLPAPEENDRFTFGRFFTTPVKPQAQPEGDPDKGPQIPVQIEEEYRHRTRRMIQIVEEE